MRSQNGAAPPQKLVRRSKDLRILAPLLMSCIAIWLSPPPTYQVDYGPRFFGTWGFFSPLRTVAVQTTGTSNCPPDAVCGMKMVCKPLVAGGLTLLAIAKEALVLCDTPHPYPRTQSGAGSLPLVGRGGQTRFDMHPVCIVAVSKTI